MLPIIISFFIITAVNMIAYLWAYERQSDHLTDLSYSACFILVVIYFLFIYGDLTFPRITLALLVIIWGVRLGGFLFYRIHQMGKDVRFDSFRGSQKGFLKFWLLQSVSIWIIVLPVIVGLMSDIKEVHWPAVVLWTIGWLLESIADYQKFTFRSKYSEQDFIDTGLFKYIRHPNYLGEILIWAAVFLYVTPYVSGWMWLTIVSPLWIVILLVWISGIPLIEKTYPSKYANNARFDLYLSRSWKLIPFIY
jgi:steroid 5-alpha reductase family enzyme